MRKKARMVRACFCRDKTMVARPTPTTSKCTGGGAAGPPSSTAAYDATAHAMATGTAAGTTVARSMSTSGIRNR